MLPDELMGIGRCSFFRPAPGHCGRRGERQPGELLCGGRPCARLVYSPLGLSVECEQPSRALLDAMRGRLPEPAQSYRAALARPTVAGSRPPPQHGFASLSAHQSDPGGQPARSLSTLRSVVAVSQGRC